MTAPTPNAELAYAVLDHIDAHPESWDQAHWWSERAEIWPEGAETPTCGTSGCFAGWAVHLSGERAERGYVNGEAIWNRAAQLLGFEGEAQMDWYAITQADNPSLTTSLFHASNTREDLGRLVAEIFGPRPEPPCGRCGHPFDPADTAFDGHARHRETRFCRSCVSRCHESTDFAHQCVICADDALLPFGTGEEMQPPPCADHEQSELNCAVCGAQRRAFYAALGREDGATS